MNKYLADVIIPNFQPLINQKICTVIKDCDGKIVCATNMLVESAGFEEYTDLLGASYEGFNLQHIEGKMHVDEEISRKVKLYFSKLDLLEKATIQEKMIVNYIDFLPYRNKYVAWIGSIIPIFDLSGQVVGTQSFYSECNLFGLNDYFKQLHELNKTSKNISEESGSLTQLNLTQREKEISYLLVHGFSQYEMSEILQVTRGTIAKTVSEKICPKFGISGSNSKILSDILKNSGYFEAPPKSLLRPTIIILDAHIKEKYFP